MTCTRNLSLLTCVVFEPLSQEPSEAGVLGLPMDLEARFFRIAQVPTARYAGLVSGFLVAPAPSRENLRRYWLLTFPVALPC